MEEHCRIVAHLALALFVAFFVLLMCENSWNYKKNESERKRTLLKTII